MDKKLKAYGEVMKDLARLIAILADVARMPMVENEARNLINRIDDAANT